MDTRLDIERAAIAAENDLSDTLHDLETVTAERDALLVLIADLRTVTYNGAGLLQVCRCPYDTFVRPGERPRRQSVRSDRVRDPDWHDDACVWRRLMQAGDP